jgi:hypothetical protein
MSVDKKRERALGKIRLVKHRMRLLEGIVLEMEILATIVVVGINIATERTGIGDNEVHRHHPTTRITLSVDEVRGKLTSVRSVIQEQDHFSHFWRIFRRVLITMAGEKQTNWLI